MGEGISTDFMSSCTNRSGLTNKASKARKTPLENTAKSYKQKTIDEALSVNLADGIFIITFYNSRHSAKEPDSQINPFEIFAAASQTEIEDWIKRSKMLMSSCYAVGIAFIDKSTEYEKIRDDFINSNPGFSDATYGRAFYIGATAACF
ncbi:hypothetical protein [Methylomagnum ishizawai]|uniref:hypothetical protein n=1 Tax=Methylomagnum ishizawai TaxID=1760988 RepID=UPI001C32E5CA|nr:hypothetical protein [Methylomagnum ishizawai]BBL74551.1 hypothetical protein MishRS11D_16490 [Methylomagnum ishizawai]